MGGIGHELPLEIIPNLTNRLVLYVSLPVLGVLILAQEKLTLFKVF